MIQTVLDRRSRGEAGAGATAATLSVVTRLLPSPRALLSFQSASRRGKFEHLITPDLFECDIAPDRADALRLLDSRPHAVLITDDVQLIRQLRTAPPPRPPCILFVAERDEAEVRDDGLAVGADECVGMGAGERELRARLSALRRVAELQDALRTALTENRRLSASDDLTGLASRRFFNKHFPREVNRAIRYGRSLALLLCDIDHFKQINDTHGHPGGDEVLTQFGQRLQRGLRDGVDWVARIGGEEFAVVMPETCAEQALQVARKLRAAVSQLPFTVGDRAIAVTASFGLCAADAPGSSARQVCDLMMKTADAALYRSKHDGRNRVTRAALSG